MSLYLAAAWPTWVTGLVTVFSVLVSLMLVLTVLIQKPQGGGLSGAFGGGSGSGQTAFGTKTGDALTVFTIIVFVIYLGFAITLNYATQAASGKGNKAPQAEKEPQSPAQQNPADNGQPPAQPGVTPPVPAKPEGQTPMSPAPTPPPQQAPAETPKTPEAPKPAEPTPDAPK